MSGNVAADPLAASTIVVVDQIDKNRGLDQRASLHCGRFGVDAAFGTVTAATYTTTPSWHKVNRNPRAIILSSSTGYSNSTVFDNLFVQHQIPRSEQQYLWITSSLANGETIFGLDSPLCLTSSTMNKQIVQGPSVSGVPLPLVPLNIQTIDPLSASTHTLGYPLSVNATSSYVNQELLPVSIFSNDARFFNALMLNRNGPYQAPMWKQIRVGETKVARELRKRNLIGVTLPPPMLSVDAEGRKIQSVRGKQSNEFVDYIEQPISTRHRSVKIQLEDNTEDSNKDNNITLNITYGNLLDHFSNEGLNNRLGIAQPSLHNNALNTVFDYLTSSNMSTLVDYGERIYPAEVNAYKNVVRRGTSYVIDDIWNNNRLLRSSSTAHIGSQGKENSILRPFGQSVWPLDGHLKYTTTFAGLPQNATPTTGLEMGLRFLLVMHSGTHQAKPAKSRMKTIPLTPTG